MTRKRLVELLEQDTDDDTNISVEDETGVRYFIQDVVGSTIEIEMEVEADDDDTDDE